MVRFKVAKLERVSNGCTCVSIPIWFDLKFVSFIEERAIIVVSIPIWFDLKKFKLLSYDTFTNVSIPIWFDLKHPYFGIRETEPMFQFLYGSI